MRSTHTFATLDLSPEAFAEIKAKLEAAGYQDAFHNDGTVIDMHGIGVQAEAPEDTRGNTVRPHWLRDMAALKVEPGDVVVVRCAEKWDGDIDEVGLHLLSMFPSTPYVVFRHGWGVEAVTHRVLRAAETSSFTPEDQCTAT